MQTVRIGLVGAGGIAGAHARGYAQLRELGRVVAVCDVVGEAAARRARELEVERTYTDWRQLLAATGDQAVDAVDICLPHDQHAEVTMAALAAGKHVLVEKPIATTTEDAWRMVDAARRAGRVLQVGHNERFDPQYQEMRRLVLEGAIGEVFGARADHNQNVVLPAGHWLRDAVRSGGGSLIGSGIHRVDLLRWLVGEVVEVSNVQLIRPERLEGEALAFTTFRFSTGALGELSTNWAVRRFPWYELMWLYGSEGSLHNVGGLHLDSTRRPETSEGFVSIPLRAADSFTEEIRDFMECVREGREALVSGAEGARTLEVCLAAYRSAELGQPVRL